MTRVIEGPDGSTCTDGGAPTIRILNEITVFPGSSGEPGSGGDEDGVTVELGSAEVMELAGMSSRRREAALATMIVDAAERHRMDIDKVDCKPQAARIAELLDKERLTDFLGDDLIGKLSIKMKLFKFKMFGKKYQVSITIGLDVGEAD